MGESRRQIQDGAAYDIGVIDMRVCMKREDCIGCQFYLDAATEAAEGCPVGAIEIE